MSLFQRGDFMLHSGARSPFKIECDALTAEDWDALAALVARLVQVAREIIGIPRGGLLFAEALRRHVRVDPNPIYVRLVADDVFTSGASLGPYQERRPYPDLSWGTYGVVVFARGPYPAWVFPLFQLAPWAAGDPAARLAKEE